jgi:ligand-binding SRPBCC domain-containing protein
VEGFALRRHTHLRAREHQLLHARQGRHLALARSGDVEDRSRLSADEITRIELETWIAAPPERCFDLSLDVGVHLASTRDTNERVVEGPTSGALGIDDTVTWEARHFGRRRRLRVRISEYDRPRMFRDEMVRGPFRRMRHDHWFEPRDGGTRMRDEFEFSFAPLVDRFVLAPHLRRLLSRRNELIRERAEAPFADNSSHVRHA